MTFEAKYTFPTGLADVLHEALQAGCPADPDHPVDTINSIYFDTPGRIHLAEKVNSDYLKSKVRLRWYSPPQSTDENMSVQAFLEVKAKTGYRRQKGRVEVEIPLRFLQEGAEEFSELQHLARLAGQCGYIDVGPLHPMIAIRYVRRRFSDGATGSRISLDSNISMTGVNARFFAPTEPRTLAIGVLEIKSATGDLPPCAAPVRNFLNKKDAFSKYEECWQLHQDPLYRREFQWMHFER